MADVKVTLNLRGLNKIMTGPEITADVVRRTQRMADAAGDGFEAVILPHEYTARGYVRTANAQGRARQAREKVLQRSLDAGR